MPLGPIGVTELQVEVAVTGTTRDIAAWGLMGLPRRPRMALGVLPPEIHHLELFGALQNTRLATFAADQGYQASPGTLRLIRGVEAPLPVPDGIASLAQEDPDVLKSC